MRYLPIIFFIYSTSAQAEPVQFAENGHWYDVIPFSGTWEEARVHAKSLSWKGLQGHLASPSRASEVQFVSKLDALVSCQFDPICQARYRLGFWLGGLQRSGIEEPDKAWSWETPNESIDWIQPWNSGEPNDWSGVNENRLSLVLASETDPPTPIVPSCIETPSITGYSWWNDTAEDTVLNGYIIEYNDQGRSRWEISEGGNGHWYAIVEAPDLSWEEARAAANAVTWQGMRGQLATFTSQEELDFITAILEKRIFGCSCTAACTFVKSTTVRARQYWAGGIYEQSNGWSWLTGEAWEFDRLHDPALTDGEIGDVGYLELSDIGNEWVLTDGVPTDIIGPATNNGYVIEFGPDNLNDQALMEIFMEQGRQDCRDDPASCDISCGNILPVFNVNTGTLSISSVEVVNSNAPINLFADVTLAIAPECGADALRVTGGTPVNN